MVSEGAFEEVTYLIFTRVRGRLCPFRGVMVEMLLVMGGIGQYLLIVAMDTDVKVGSTENGISCRPYH